jgi:hypothetical protein
MQKHAFITLFCLACCVTVFGGEEAPKPAAADEVEAAKAKISGLKLWLKLDEKEGAKAANSVEKGVAVEVTGGKWTQEGKFGGALTFNGESDQAVTAASVHEAFADGDVTIAVWIKPAAGGVVVDELGQPGVNEGWHDSQIELMDDGEVKVRVWELTGLSVGKIKLNEWHHVVMRYSKKDQRLDGFVDGVKSQDKVDGEKQWNNGGDIYYAFGAKDDTNLGQGGFFKGLMDDVRIYNRALTEDEVKLLAGVKKD